VIFTACLGWDAQNKLSVKIATPRLVDLFECLRFVNGELQFSSDYLRGRCLKTDITVRKNGQLTLSTRNRGKTALRWLDRLQGKKMLKLI